MFQRTKVSTAVFAALGVSLLAGTAPSAAQQAPTAPAAQPARPAASSPSAQRIEITGSLIRRIEGEAALPVTTLRADDLVRAGVTNAEQAVTFITQQQSGTVSSSSVSGTNGAAAYVDLRSLGANRTLVLLNGKRVVSNPYASAAVDLNSMPIGALERIETLSDGASSTYGTDAIAGVVNFITRRAYRGFSVAAQAQITDEGGGNTYTGNLLGGLGDLASDGWNVFGAVNYRDQKPLGGTERDFMRTSYIPSQGFNGTSPTTFPANYTQGTLTANPSLASGCLAPTSIPVPEANGTTIRCFADTQAFTDVVPIQEQWGAFVKGSLALGANHTASVEYFKSYNKIQSRIAPSPETTGMQLFPNSPFYPGRGITPANPALNTTQPITTNWRTSVLGSRSGKQENDTQRAVVSLDGSAMNWDYTASLLWSAAKVENFFLNGYPQTNPLRAGLRGCSVDLVANACPASGTAVPFLNPFGDQTAAGLAYLQSIQVLGLVQTGEATVKSASAQVSRSFGSLPGGPIGVALIAEARQEEMSYITDIPKVSQAASSGLAGSGAVRQGDRDIEAVGVEVSVPLSTMFEVNFAVRHDRYSDFGNTTNPKLSLRFRPTDALLLRGSVNSGFSAPTLTRLYEPNATTFTGTRYNDPVLCPGGVLTGGVATRDCGLQFQRLTGGNPNLKAEESSAYTVGFLLQATSSFSFGMDYWSYRIHDSVSTIGEQAIFGDPAKYASLFVRCSQAPAERRALIPGCNQAGPGDALAYIVDTNANLGDVKTEGIDIQADYTTGATRFGRFGVAGRGSYVRKYHFQVEPRGSWFDPVGTYNAQFAGPVIRYQQVTRLTWDYGMFSVLLSNRFKSGYRDQNTNAAPFNTNRVNSYSLMDLSVSARPLKGLTVSAGVLNLFDREPPFSNQTSRFQARGYDDRIYNPLGRTYQVGAKYEF